MKLKVEVSLDCKIEDLFKVKRFVKFCEYCKINGIVYLHQLESVDFVMYKSSFDVTDDEKNCAREYWKTLVDIANGTLKQEDCSLYEDDIYSEVETNEEQLCVAEDDYQVDSAEYLTIEESNDNDQDSFEESEIASLISRIEKYYSAVKSYITIDSCDKPVFWKGISDAECQIINTKPNVFYKCTAKRFVLVKWIVDQVERVFEENGGIKIDINNIYSHLGEFFGVVSFNRENLRKLFHTVDEIEYSDFKKIRDKYLSDYYQATGCQTLENNYYLNNEIDRGDRQTITLTPQVKSFLNSAFEEEIYDLGFVTEEIRNDEIEDEIHNRITSATEELGKDACVWFIKNIEGTIRISSILKSYIKSCEEAEIFRNKVAQSISLINLCNYNARVAPLIKAIKIDNISKESIMLLFEKAQISRVSEMSRLLSLSITNKDYIQIMNFFKWLCQDIKQSLRDELSKLFKSDRDETVVKRRASGATLEETGKEFGITRERIRQIEKKFHGRFTSYVSRLNPHLILNAFSENTAYIRAEEVAEVYGEMTDMFIYCLKECNCTTVFWAEQLQGFIIGDVSWYERIKEYLDELPEMLEMASVDSLVINLAELTNTPLDIESIKNMIINEYKLSGQVYLRKKMRTFEMYLAVIDKYYSEGIKLYDAFETKRFRGYLKEMFGDVNLPDNNRAIDAVIGRITVLCDRGKYTLPSRISVPMDLLEKIRIYINESDRSIIMFAELYERFKDELVERSNITNRYFLQGVLRYYYPNDFFYTRDTLNKDSNNESSIRIAIEEFVKQEGRVVSKEELKQEFAGITDAVLLNAFYTTHDLLAWDFGQYLHSSLLNISEGDYQKVGMIVEEQVSSGFITARKLFDILYMSNSEFMTRNNIHTHTSLFSVIMYMFLDKYEFRRPYISQKGSPTQTKYDILKDYLSEKDSFKISELKEFCDEMQIKIMTMESLIEGLGDEFIRVDADNCMRKDMLCIADDVIEAIDDVTESLMMNNHYISLRKVNDFFYYPDIGVEWTQFLLESIICEYSKRFKIIELDYRDYRYVSGIIVDRGSNISSYEEILRYALIRESENSPFRSKEEVEKWLKEQELIVKSIPQMLLDRGIVDESEYGVINIQ